MFFICLIFFNIEKIIKTILGISKRFFVLNFHSQRVFFFFFLLKFLLFFILSFIDKKSDRIYRIYSAKLNYKVIL